MSLSRLGARLPKGLLSSSGPLMSVLLAVGFAALFQTTAFATYYIPSESMVPTLQVGDRVAVSKFAYGWSRYSLPYGLTLPSFGSDGGRLFAEKPRRGDVVVFIHPRNGQRMIKRVIGLPGDRVAIRAGRLVINGEPVVRRFVRLYRFREYEGRVVEVRQLTETLPGGTAHTILERTGARYGEDMAEETIPPGRYFMMGDNRDNSADSRFPQMGLVPEENLIGRAEAILYTLYSCDPEPGVVCADRRFAQKLE
jgi:signal peptidase I